MELSVRFPWLQSGYADGTRDDLHLRGARNSGIRTAPQELPISTTRVHVISMNTIVA